MCERELVIDDVSNNRRRNKVHQLVMLTSWGSSSSSSQFAGRSSPYRTLCLLTAGLAFILGLVVGVMIPLYMLPRGLAPPSAVRRNVTLSPPRTRGTNDAEAATQFPSVAFVANPEVPVTVLRSGAQDSDQLFEEGVYWGRRVEDAMPAGFEESEAESWRRFARKTTVVKVEEGCGRMQNRLLTFEDGTRSCCRYRQNTDQIQGELFSFYLGRVLGLRNLAPSSLALVRLREPLWSRVRPQLSLAQWSEDRAVVLTRFVPYLEPAHIPPSLRTAARRLHPPDIMLSNDSATAGMLTELAQWSDLILFDYLTANLDRVVNNLYNLQWNPAMMDAPAHNLAREPNSGLLIFFDNESGLLHGYRLLGKYEAYHGALLQSLCVFRRSTADAIKRLHRNRDVGTLLQARFDASDPEFRDFLPSLPDKSIKILNERIDRVHKQITRCERQYSVRRLS